MKQIHTCLFFTACLSALGLQAQTPSIAGHTTDTLDAHAETFDGAFKPIASLNVAAQDVLTTFEGTQYVAWYNSDHRLCLARKALGGSTWEKIIFTDYLKTSTDSHNGIAIGICPGDGSIHLAFDNHNDTLNYRYSVPALATPGSAVPWEASSFLPVQHHLESGSTFTDKFTYPRFLATPEGNLLLHYRSFVSQINNRLALYDANAGTWTGDWRVISGSGTYTDPSYGTSTARRMYDNRLTYDPYGTLTTSFTWRENDVPPPLSSYNHDIGFMYSEDNGATWKNNANAVVTDPSTGTYANIDSPDLTVVDIAPGYKMINDQGHAVDPQGGVHVVMMQGDEPQQTYGFLSNGYFRHHWRKADGTWLTRELPYRGERPRLLCDKYGNLLLMYFNVNTFYIASSSPTDDYDKWKVIFSEQADFHNSFAVDNIRFQDSGKLSLVAQAWPAVLGDPTPIYVMDFDLNYAPLPCSVSDQGCPATTLTLNPVDDTFTRGGNYANDTLGVEKQKVLAVKYANDDGNKHVVTYLRFALAPYAHAGRLVKASLRMHVKKVVGNHWETDGYELWRCSHDFWTEEILTNNSLLKPGLSDPFGVVLADPDTMVWDVTGLMREELLGDDWLSLAIVGTAGATGHVVFNSKEANNAALHPELVLEFAGNRISPTDDAYVRGGAYAIDNFGESIELVIKEDGNSDYDRTAFLKFDVSDYTGTPVRQVLLHMDKKAMSPKAHITPYAAYAVEDDAWSENTVTFNDRPAVDTTMLSAQYGRDAMGWDVTSAFNLAKEGDGTLSLALKSLLEGGDRNVNLYSKEFPDPTLHPRLVVLYDRALPDAGTPPAAYAGLGPAVDMDVDLPTDNEPLVYPNPAKDVFRVVMPTSEAATLQILSATGVLLGSHAVGSTSEGKYSTADLPSGLYFIRIVETNGPNAWTVKLVRQ